jgi:hypothetical protein
MLRTLPALEHTAATIESSQLTLVARVLVQRVCVAYVIHLSRLL